MTAPTPRTFPRPLLIAMTVFGAILFTPLLLSAGGGLLWYKLKDIEALPALIALACFAGGMVALQLPERHGPGVVRLLRFAGLSLACFLLLVSAASFLLILAEPDLGGSWGLFGTILSLMILIGHIVPLVAVAGVLLFVSLKAPGNVSTPSRPSQGSH